MSPTAHYTAYVWYRNGLSHPALATKRGRLMYSTMRLTRHVYEAVVGMPHIEASLLTRHRLIDHLLERAISDEGVTQVLEVAAGLSPRGIRFAERYPDLRYVEADLPNMAAHKRRILGDAGLERENHRVTTVDALTDSGERSLGRVAASHLEPMARTAVITEGLLVYLDRHEATGLLGRVADVLLAQGGGVYLSDTYLERDSYAERRLRARRWMLQLGVRRGIYTPVFESAAQGGELLRSLGFATADFHHPAQFARDVEIPGPHAERHVVRVLSAWRRP